MDKICPGGCWLGVLGGCLPIGTTVWDQLKVGAAGGRSQPPTLSSCRMSYNIATPAAAPPRVRGVGWVGALWLGNWQQGGLMAR
jgi:hypothetical protein